MYENLFLIKTHQYLLHSDGTTLKDKVYNSRLEANIAMNSYCSAHGIVVECTEDNKHSKKYSNHRGVRFYINRI